MYYRAISNLLAHFETRSIRTRSILAALATFKKMWVSREEFEEDGAAALHKKTF